LLLVSLSIWTPFITALTDALEAYLREKQLWPPSFCPSRQSYQPSELWRTHFRPVVVLPIVLFAVFFFSGVHLTGERAIFTLGFRPSGCTSAVQLGLIRAPFLKNERDMKVAQIIGPVVDISASQIAPIRLVRIGRS
jgi:hypothetical protein